MKLLAKSFLISLVLICSNLWAHPDGHGKPRALFKEQAIEAADYYKNNLIKEGSLDQQWKDSKVSDAAIKRIEYRNHWVVTYTLENDKLLDITMTSSGDFVSSKARKAD